ncbi:GntR family transcriptional regulator [Brevundimonas sp. FT23042]|uniref:GntR family transcriptional regulator n=1 Tax=Brevundimonas sp. FT23042 TaxID=3393749 RepID=UPI003B5898AF
MRARDPFGTALASLRTALENGLAPGQHLPINDVATALKLSTSPVREALSRLCGEGLIEDRRGQGYFTRPIPLEDVQGLLSVERAHVRLAADASGDAPPAATDLAVETWMASLMENCANVPLVESFERVHRRLEPLRRFNGPTQLRTEIAPALYLDAYYDRWGEAAVVLTARLRRIDPADAEYTSKIV